MTERSLVTHSQHFSRAELACRHCGRIVIQQKLLDALETLRAHLGRPVTIVDAYRCPTHNRAVGGARRSQHMLGAAADLPEGLATVEDAERAGFTGIGSHRGWAVHVDVRAAPARWTYDDHGHWHAS